jgi:acetyltransferase
METTRTLLSSYGLALVGSFTKDTEGIPAALSEVGVGPYALKAISPDVVHKSDAGAVAIGLLDEGAVRGAWNAIVTSITAKHPGAVIEGMLLQRMTPGREVIIGMKRDATFGPVIVFGLGGIFVEILKDASTRIAPVSLEEARAQVRSIKAAKLLQGARGTAPVDEDALVAIIVALSRLVLEHPEIEEIDLNPVMAGEHGATIVDARFMKKQ